MRIADDHMYHGAALIQIAEHESFTAINEIKIKNKRERSAYRINVDTAILVKHATTMTTAHSECVFTFNANHIKVLRTLAALHEKAFIVLVCVPVKEICAITVDQLNAMITARKKAAGGDEDQYTVLVTAEAGKSLRVYMNQPGVKNTILGKELVIPRKAFPDVIFG